VALERGELGELVRVRAVDGKHEVLRGRLCGEHVVRSES
jgi:flagella basal body P-ring formation protein FlgA